MGRQAEDSKFKQVTAGTKSSEKLGKRDRKKTNPNVVLHPSYTEYLL